VTKIISVTIMSSVTTKAGAKHELLLWLLFNKPASGSVTQKMSVTIPVTKLIVAAITHLVAPKTAAYHELLLNNSTSG